jgi:protein-tyrosine phosphatase
MPSVIRVCFVCLGNICRSPIAEGVFRHLVSEAKLDSAFEIDSAGTAGYHSGDAPDSRARAAGQRAGIVVGGRARQFVKADLARFDYVIAMDATNLTDLVRLAGSEMSKLRLMRSFDPDAPPRAPIPDPYYGADRGFDEVLELCRVACRHLLSEIRAEHGL